MTRLPVSFGVLLLGLGVTWVVGLTLGGFLLRQAEQNAIEANRALERRLGEQLAQLTTFATALEAEQDLLSHRHAAQADQLERLTAEAEALRGRVRNERVRRRERR